MSPKFIISIYPMIAPYEGKYQYFGNFHCISIFPRDGWHWRPLPLERTNSPINATIGFKELGVRVNMPAKSLMRMLGPAGPGLLLLFALFAAVAVPWPLSESGLASTQVAHYNRWGWALLTTLWLFGLPVGAGGRCTI